MGILNTTPDSFYDGGKYFRIDDALTQAQNLLNSGIDILDVGGASSRPGAEEITIEKELERTIPVIKEIKKNNPKAKISIDTYRSKVAQLAIENGACMINDISAGRLDPNMLTLVASLQVPYIAMHSRGNPSNMNMLTQYQDLEFEIIQELKSTICFLQEHKIKDLILDIGIGFAKNLEQNFRLIKNLSYFNGLNLPILVGVSRKSMIYKHLKIHQSEALNGTTALNMASMLAGASILRVHDAKEALECRDLFTELIK
jgi:dihydropteroate synthase